MGAYGAQGKERVPMPVTCKEKERCLTDRKSTRLNSSHMA